MTEAAEPDMNPDSQSRICPRCGCALAPGTGCARCVLEEALAAEAETFLTEAHSPDDAPNPGETISYIGDYELVEVIARGGMGVVYRARQTSLNRVVALKMLLGGQHAGEEFKRRFRQEAEAVARLRHPHIVTVYEVGEDRGQPYFSMDYVAGGSLADLVRAQPLLPARAARYTQTIAEAIEYAHGQGILHRDLKPSNVLVDAEDQVHITDFGLAKDLANDSTLTQTGQALGSPGYLPPEQVSAKTGAMGAHSDVYSIGALLYHLLTGRPPFLAATLGETLQQVTELEPVPPQQLNPFVPKDLATICLKCLAKEPSGRYRSAAALADDLRRFLHGEPIMARPVGPGERLWRWCRRNPVLAGMFGTSALLLVFGLTGILWQWRRAEVAKTTLAAHVCQMEVRQAEAWFAADKARQALPYLARTLRQHPQDPVPASRLLSALSLRNYPLLTAELADSTTNECDGAFFTADGRRVVTASHDGSVSVWEGSEGRAVAHWVCHTQPIRDLALNAGGDRLITASQDGTARIWTLPAGTPVTPPLPHGDSVGSVRLSPDGQWLATTADDGKCRIWDATSGALLHTLSNAPGISAVEFSHREGRMLTVSGEKVQVWGTRPSPSPLFSLPHAGKVMCAEFSPDGRQVATGAADKNARVWAAQTGQLLGVFSHPFGVSWVRFSPDGGRVLTVGEDRVIRIWDRVSGASLGKVAAYRQCGLNSVEFSPDGLLMVTAADDQTARVWDARTGEPAGEPMAHENYVLSASFAPDGQRVVTRCWHGPVRVWDVRPGPALPAMLRHQHRVNVVRFSPDNRQILTVSSNSTLTLWNTDTLRPLSKPLAEAPSVEYAVFSPDGHRIATQSEEGGIRIWETASGRQLRSIAPSPATFRLVTFSPDGLRLGMVYSNLVLRLWDVGTGEVLTPPMVNDGGSTEWGETIHGLSFSSDGRRVATACHNGTAQIWDTATGRRTLLIRHEAPVIAAIFTPDDRRLVTASFDRTARVWDSATGQAITPPMRHSGELLTIDLSPDGRRLVSGCVGGMVQVWDALSGCPVADPVRYEEVSQPDANGAADDVLRISTVQFSPRNDEVLTAIFGQIARLSDPTTGLPLSEPLAHPGEKLLNARFLPHARWFAVKTRGPRVYVWETPLLVVSSPAWLAELAEALAGTRFNSAGQVEPVAGAELLSLRRRLSSLAGTDDASKWARWFWADRASRTVSPSLPITVGEFVRQLVDEDDCDSLRRAVSMSPTNSLALARLGRAISRQDPLRNPRRLREADFLTARALALASDSPEIVAIRQEIERALSPSPDP